MACEHSRPLSNLCLIAQVSVKLAQTQIDKETASTTVLTTDSNLLVDIIEDDNKEVEPMDSPDEDIVPDKIVDQQEDVNNEETDSDSSLIKSVLLRSQSIS